jgi:hypothetical protein
VHARHALARDREQAERVMVAQRLLVGEREFRQVGQRFQVVRVHAGVIKSLAIVRDVVVGVLERPAQAFQLQRLQFVAAGVLDRVERAGL